MQLSERINADIKTAMKARDSRRLDVLRLLKSALDYAAIENKVDAPTDELVVQTVQKEIKKRRDSAQQYEQAGRAESAEAEKSEITVLEDYLPQQLSPEELESLIRECIAEVGATSRKEMGLVIKTAVAKAAGRADGKAISGLAGKLLSQ